MRTSLVPMTFLSYLALCACSKEDSESSSKVSGDAVTVNFQAVVGAEALACGKTYQAIGTTASAIEVRDFRFFVYNPQVISEDGSKVDLTLTKDGVWQRDKVALLDFTDGTGLCDPTGATQNTQLTGTIPTGTKVKGFSFQFGLPPSLNHLDAATETAPFNETGMWWTWKGGYKFARFDFKSTAQDNFFFHMGATSCTGSIEAGFSCAYDHEAIISFSELDPSSQAITLDIKELLSGSDLDSPANSQAGDFVKGCMAFAGDPECPSIFQKLGLVFSSKDAGPVQTAFSVTSKE